MSVRLLGRERVGSAVRCMSTVSAGRLESALIANHELQDSRSRWHTALHPLGRKASNLLDHSFFGHGRVRVGTTANTHDWPRLEKEARPLTRREASEQRLSSELFSPEQGMILRKLGSLHFARLSGKSSARCQGKVASLMPASWNQIALWLQEIDALRGVA